MSNPKSAGIVAVCIHCGVVALALRPAFQFPDGRILGSLSPEETELLRLKCQSCQPIEDHVGATGYVFMRGTLIPQVVWYKPWTWQLRPIWKVERINKKGL